MKVRATNMYTEKHIEDAQLKRIPKEGEEWEVTEERYNQLRNNVYGVEFVNVVTEESKEDSNEGKEESVNPVVEIATKKVVTEKTVKGVTKKSK